MQTVYTEGSIIKVSINKEVQFMKRYIPLIIVLVIVTSIYATVAAADSNDEMVSWFQAVSGWSGPVPKTESIYAGDQLVLAIPEDWSQAEYEDSLCAFEGSDETGNRAIAVLRVVDGDGITIDEMAEQTKGSKVSCQIKKGDMTIFVALEGGDIYSAWLSSDDKIYIIMAALDSPSGMQSLKLTADLHQILCGLRLPYDGELEEVRTRAELSKREYSEEEKVAFKDTEFEHMVREAMGKAEGEVIYAPELEAITRLSMRFGLATFSEDIIQPVLGYKQSAPLDLSDLALFPNLRFLSITDMTCSGFETLKRLPKLRDLTLIDAGVTDCGVLEDLSLESLSLARNNIEDFSALASMAGLKSLNLFMTGIESLDVLSDLTNLEILVVGGNPVSDLKPIERMNHLRYLAIQETDVETLDALKNLKALETLNISDLGAISLEPLYGHENIKEILALGTQLDVADKERFTKALGSDDFFGQTNDLVTDDSSAEEQTKESNETIAVHDLRIDVESRTITL